MTPKYFVWLPSQTGPQAQLWHNDEPKNGEGKAKCQPLFRRLLDTSEADLSLTDLITKYPAP